jgi:hypothetical protein
MENNTKLALDPLTRSEKILALSKLIGFKSVPPSIDTLISDDYYLGSMGKSLYPIWKERLLDFYPNPILSKSTILSLGGGLGTGKSYMAMMCTLIDILKFSLHPDPFKFLGLNKLTSPTFCRMFNLDKARAWSVLVVIVIN